MTTSVDTTALRRSLAGPLVAHDEPGWDAARQAWNLAVDQRPAHVAQAASVEDIVAVVEFARGNGLRIATQGTGHGAATLGPLDDAVLLKTVGMGGIEVDPGARRVRVEAGVVWGDVALRAAEHGLAALAGTGPDVGVVGYTLYGGIGWLARRYGLASNSVLAIELVTAEGEVARVDHDREPDLFWALRGGGGGFGVVTALELALYPVAEAFGGMLAWPAADGGEVLDAYRTWTREAPDDLTSGIRYLNLPPLPEVPEPMRGPVIALDAAYLGGPADGEELLRPLRAAGSAVLDSFGAIATADLRSLHGDPEQPTAAAGDGFLLRELSAEAVEALIAVGGPGSGSPLLALEVRHLGGALAAPPAGHGALGALEGEYALYGVGAAISPDAVRAIDAHLDEVTEAMAPWASERAYLNFSDREADPAAAFAPETYRRLREVKRRYDPRDLFLANKPIPPLD